MDVYSVGPDEYPPEPSKHCRWVVYWYQSGDYDGTGEAVALFDDGTLRADGLGHCSCYGGWDSGGAGWGSVKWGSHDAPGASLAAEWVLWHIENCGPLQIVHSDSEIPDDYTYVHDERIPEE